MKHLRLFFFATFFLWSLSAFSQGIVNNGADIVISSGTYLVVDEGAYLNQTSGDDGKIDIDGFMHIDGDFTNNATAGNVFSNADADGEVVFTGSGTQTIKGTGEFINFEKLTVNASSNTDLAAAFAMTTKGDLTVNGTFTLKCGTDDSPTGSLITEADLSGTGTLNVERYLNVNGHWQYISVPISGQNTSLLTEDPNPGHTNPNFYTYNEAFDAAVDPSNTNYASWTALTDAWISPGATLDNGAIGYSLYHQWSDVDAVFSGAPADLNHDLTGYTPSLSYTPNDANSNYFDGWNFIGNPYPAAIDWEDLGLTNVDATVYLWNRDLPAVGGSVYPGNYVYYNTGSGSTHDEYADIAVNSDANARYIPAMQGFFIKTNAASPSININAAAREHHTNAMYKSEQEPEGKSFDYLKIKVEASNGFTDETAVRFLAEAQAGFDSDFDAYKMFPWSDEIPMVYTLTDSGLPVAINSLSSENIEKTVPVAFKAEAGNYTVTIPEFSFADTRVYITDTHTDKTRELVGNDNFSFNFEGGDIRDRFFLFFQKEATDIDDYKYEKDVQLWSSGEKIHIELPGLPDASQAEVYNILGQKILFKNLNAQHTVLKESLPSGTYIVKVKHKGEESVKKLFVK